MKVHLHYMPLLSHITTEDMKQLVLRTDGVHFGYYTEAPMDESTRERVKLELEKAVQLNRHNLIGIVGYSLSLPMTKNPTCGIIDTMYEIGINPLLLQEFSDFAKIWGSRYIQDGQLFWYETQSRGWTSRPVPAPVHHKGIR